ncbi:hypothetical protein AC1031_018931 [Aphanomyces cochlioides]|nr:hypothetical protein AC1031_018931 [Aphanomyces cochlioides]
MLDRPAAIPIVHSSTGDSNEKSAYELLFDDDSAIEKAQSEVDDRDDDSFGEEPLYNPGAPPQPTLQCTERAHKARLIKAVPNGDLQVPEKHKNRLSKRIKLVGEKDKGKSSIAEAIANGMKVQSETQSQIAERFISLQESQINFENSERVRKRKVDEIFRQGEFMKTAGFSNDDVMEFVNDSMKSLD